MRLSTMLLSMMLPSMVLPSMMLPSTMLAGTAEAMAQAPASASSDRTSDVTSLGAEVAGRVTDATGGVIPGAIAVIELPAGSRIAAADREGRFGWRGLPPGTVRVTVAHPGFATAIRDVTLARDARVTLEIALAAQALSETLMVVADAPSYVASTTATGSKIAVPALENPQSVSVVTRQSLEDRQVLKLSETAQAVAGVIPAPGYGGLPTADFTIRGFRPAFSGGNNLRNGYRDFNFLTPRDLQGIERVEFLKGPASLLYGLAEVGGMTNTISKRPLRAFSAAVGLQFGAFGLVRPTIDVTGPVGDSRTLFYRANVAYDHNHSYRDFHDNDSLYLDGSLAWQPSPATNLQIELETQRFDFVHDGGFGTSKEFVTLPVSRFLGEPDFNHGLNRQASGTIELSHVLSDRWSYRGAFNMIASESTLRFVSNRGLQENRRLMNRSAIASVESSTNVSLQHELYGTLRTGRVSHTVIAGLDLATWRFLYLWDEAALAPIDIHEPRYGARPGPFQPGIAEDTRTMYGGLYLVDQIKLSNRVTVHAGVRADATRLTVEDPRTRDELSTMRPSSVLPRGAIVYAVRPALSAYVSYAASFLPQAGRSREGARFDPLRGRQIEAGLKQGLFGGRALATLAGFQIWKAHVLTTDPRDPQFQVQTGAQQSRGLELELAGELWRGLSLNASYAYTDAFVSKDTETPVGTPLVNVPRHAGGILGNYRFSTGPLTGLSLGASVYAIGARRVALFSPFSLDGYGRLDLFATWRVARWRLQVNLKNAANRRYFESTSFNIHPQPPRQLVVGLTRQF